MLDKRLTDNIHLIANATASAIQCLGGTFPFLEKAADMPYNELAKRIETAITVFANHIEENER